MHPRTTNISTQTSDVRRFSFESAGVLALDNEYSGFAVLPARALQQLLGLNRLLDESAGETALEPIAREFDQQLIRGVLKRMQRKSSGDRHHDAEPI